MADSISPGISDGGKIYSEERPNKEFFGSGMSGRLSEASYLRFMGEHDLEDGNFDAAMSKLAKAVQLDPGDPGGHVLYARAMTSAFHHGLRRQRPDRELLRKCIEEWNLIWHHDADGSEQVEAKGQARRLKKIAKTLDKQTKIAGRNSLPQ